MLVEYIDEHRDWSGVEPICQVLRDTDVQIAPSTYYAAKSRPPSARAVRDAELTEDIRVVHKANLGVYGARKIHAALNREGVEVARLHVEQAEDALHPGPARRGDLHHLREARETDQARRPEGHRDGTRTSPGLVDLTYIRTHAGWTYAAFVLDVFSRRVVGWQVSTSLRTDLALDALDMGLWERRRAGQDITGLDPSQRCRSAVSSHSLHRAPRRSRRRCVRRNGRQLRLRAS